MSLWADYIIELRGGVCKFIEHEWGFISYSLPLNADYIFCEDIYVIPYERRAARAYQLLVEVEVVARSAGRSNLVFIVRTDSPNAAKNLRIYLAMSFVPTVAESGNIWLKRAIDKGA